MPAGQELFNPCKGAFADAIKLTLTHGVSSAVPWAQQNHSFAHKRGRRGTGGGDMATGAETGWMHFEDEGWDCQPRDAAAFGAGKGRARIRSGAPEGASLPTWTWARQAQSRTWTWDCKTVCLRCSKLRAVSFVTAATGNSYRFAVTRIYERAPGRPGHRLLRQSPRETA